MSTWEWSRTEVCDHGNHQPSIGNAWDELYLSGRGCHGCLAKQLHVWFASTNNCPCKTILFLNHLMYACITPSSASCHRATLGTVFVGLSVYMKSVQCQFTKSVRFIVAPIWTCLGTLDGKHIGVNAPDIDSLGIFQLFLLDPDGPWFPSQLDGVSSTGVLLRLEMLRSNRYILVQFEGYEGGQVDWKRSLDIVVGLQNGAIYGPDQNFNTKSYQVLASCSLWKSDLSWFLCFCIICQIQSNWLPLARTPFISEAKQLAPSSFHIVAAVDVVLLTESCEEASSARVHDQLIYKWIHSCAGLVQSGYGPSWKHV